MNATSELGSQSKVFPQSQFQLRSDTALLLGAHAVITLLLLYSFAFATHFTFHFRPIGALDQYRYQASGFAHFKLDAHDAAGRPMPPGCLDCMNFHQHAYLPYGPFPALFQMLLVNLLHLGTTSEAIVWAICAITLYSSFWIVRWYLRNVLALQLAAATVLSTLFIAVIGATDLYLHTSTVPYAWSQASATAQLCLLFSAFFFLKAFVDVRGQGFNLACSGLLCGLASLSKQNYFFSCGAGIAILPWIALTDRWTLRRTTKQMLSFILPVVLCVGAMLWFNWARFGNPLDSGINYVNVTPGQSSAFLKPQFHRIPYNFYNHFLAGIQVRSSDFPFVIGKSSSFGSMNRKDGSGGLLHNWPMFSLFISVPMLLIVAPGSIWLFCKLVRKPNSRELQFGIYLLLLSACTFAYFLGTDASWMRYQYDILFPISLLALQFLIYTWRAMDLLSAGLSRALLRASFSAFLLLAFVEQVALGLDQTLGLTLSHNTRFIYWSVTERPSDITLRQSAQFIRSRLFDGPPTTIVTTGPQPTPSPQPAGSIWLVRISNTVYESDGVEWTQPAPLPSWPPLSFAMAFPLRAGNGTEPLVELGEPPTADALGVHYLPNRQLQFQYDHWGYATCLGSVLRYEPGSSHAFLLRLDNTSQRASLSMDGSPVLDCANGVYSRSSSKPVWGVNRWDFTTMLPAFSGTIFPQNEKTPASDTKTQFLKVDVIFPSSHASEREPLVQFGSNPGAADLLGVKYLPDARVALFLDHWGGPECLSGSLPVRRNSPQSINVALDAGIGHAMVMLDGKTVLNCQSGVYPGSMERHILGKNTIEFTSATSVFSGSIRLPAQQHSLENN